MRDLNARRIADQPVGRGKGRHIVFHVVRAGNADLGGVEDLLLDIVVARSGHLLSSFLII